MKTLVMLNLHLITKISGKDNQFRNEIFEILAIEAEEWISRGKKSLQEEKWALFQCEMGTFLKKIQPIIQTTAFNEIQSKLEAFQSSTESLVKYKTGHQLLSNLRNGIIGAQISSTEPEIRTPFAS